MRRSWPWSFGLGVALLALLGLGCETPLDRSWGSSQRDHVAASIENPDAGVEDLEAPRLDGPSSEAALQKQRNHEAAVDTGEPESVINVEIGS